MNLSYSSTHLNSLKYVNQSVLKLSHIINIIGLMWEEVWILASGLRIGCKNGVTDQAFMVPFTYLKSGCQQSPGANAYFLIVTP